MKVLVTGASSMIGRAVVGQLLTRGDDVVTFQRRPDPSAGPGAHEVLGDLTDRTAVERSLAGRDAVIHLAAKVGVTGTWHDYHRVNVEGTARLVAAAGRLAVERFVHVSSPSVAHAGDPLVGAGADAADPRSTRGHYATTKALAELATLAASSDDLPIVAIRPHLVWGPGDTQLVGRIVDRGRRGRVALVGSGTALIDTTYVDNAADALIAALDRAPALAGRAFVVSNGEPRTVHELVQRILSAAGVDWTPRRVPRWLAVGGGHIAERVWSLTGRTDDPPMTSFLAEQLSTAHWFDQRATRSALGWEPLIGLAEGFDRLAASYRTADGVVAT